VINKHSIDFINACIHEAGHAVVARSLGFFPTWRVTASDPSTPGRRSDFEGQTSFVGELTQMQRKMIGLAGPIAEILLGTPPQRIARPTLDSEVADIIGTTYELSQADAAMAGDYTRHDVSDCCALVLRLKAEILGEVLSILS